MRTETKYWMCYVNGSRASGPVRVIPNPHAESSRDYSWLPASREIDDANLVSTATFDEAAPKPGKYESETSGSTYFITTVLTHAELFMEGARAARAAIAAYAGDDATPLPLIHVAAPDNAETVLRRFGVLPSLHDEENDL